MAIGDLFSAEGRKKRRIEKNCDRVNEKYAQSPDRFGAMEVLSREGGEAAVRSLLRRFFWAYDKGIEDHDEKEYAFKALAHLGREQVLPVLTDVLRRADGSVSWLLKLLVEMVAREEALAIVAATLTACSGNDFERDPQKRVDLIHFLQDFQTDAAVGALLPLVTDFAEEIRWTAVDALFHLKAEAAREPLLQALVSDESGRVRARIVEGLAETGWDVKGFTDKVESQLPEGYRLDKGGHVKLVPLKAAEAAKSKPRKDHGDHGH